MQMKNSIHSRYQSLFPVLVLVAAWANPPAEVSGSIENPGERFGKSVDYTLAADTTFGWRTSAIPGNIDLNGHHFLMDTGGGNRTEFSGQIRGAGSMEWRGGSVPQVAPSILSGTMPNSFNGSFTLANGILDLAKPAGIVSIPGDLVIGSRGDAVVRTLADGQISPHSIVTFGGSGISRLETHGHSLQIDGICLKAHAILDLTPDAGTAAQNVHIGARCAGWDTTKTLTIRGYSAAHITVEPGALAADALARIGFEHKVGDTVHLYRAAVGRSGELKPAAEVHAVAAPFDLGPAAQARRASLYSVDGLKAISACQPLHRESGVIDLFGDSITWLNGYKSVVQDALKSSGSQWVLQNHGINGGGVEQVRDGAKEAGYPGNSPQASFANILAADHAETAVLFIGINDVWWRKTTPEAFEKGLRDIAASAREHNVKLVVATMELHGELPDGRNADDPKIEQFCAITRKVASDTHATLVDLRRACIAYLQNNNARLRVDGTIYSAPSGILTYDGVHPNAAGTDLLARLIADGIVRVHTESK